MATVDELIVKIEADFKDLQKGLKKAGEDTEKFEDKLKDADNTTKVWGGSVMSLGKGLGAAAAATATMAAAVGVLTKKQADAAKQTKLWARRLDVTSTTFSQLAAVGRKFGTDMDTVGDAIKDLNERIADAARGNKTYEEALNAVGLQSKKLINLPVEEQFLKVADAIGKMNNAGDRNFVTAELMADAGFRLIPAFQQGEKAIREMMKQADELGHAFSESDLQTFDELDEAFIRLSESSGALGKSLTSALAPALTTAANLASDLAESLTLAVSEVGDGTQVMASGGAMISNFGDDIAAATEQVDNFEASLEHLNQVSPGAIPEIADARKPDVPIFMDDADVDGAGPSIYPSAADIPKDELLEQIMTFEDEVALIREAARVQEEEAHKAWLDRMFGADKRAQEQNVKLWEHGWKGKHQVTSKFLGQISSLMNTNSRKQFEIGKAAAIAQVAIDTPKAAMSAYSAMAGIPVVGPALGGIAAAAALATGVAQIQNIKSQSFGGGSVSGGGVDAGAAAGGAGAEREEVTNVSEVNVSLQGENFGGEQVRNLIGAINGEIEDGARIGGVNIV